jgi:hypothetical protein
MEIVLLLGTLAASIVVAVLSTGLPQLAADPGGPGLFPMAAAVVTGAASAILLAQRLFAQVAAVASGGGDALAPRILSNARANIRPLGVVVLVLLFPLGIEWIGFTEAVLVFSFLALFVSGKSLGVSSVVSVLIAAGVYVAYALILGAVLPEGELVYRLFY